MTLFRILDVVEAVAQTIPIPENETTAIIQLDSFAVTVVEVRETDQFAGQLFSVDLGKKLEDENPSLDDDDISFKKTNEIPTASLSIDSSFFEDASVTNALASAKGSDNTSQVFTSRIINSVYLTDTLFPRINATNSSFSTGSVGSIILSSTLVLTSIGETREVRVTNINPPITLTFSKKQTLANGTNSDTTCTFWDFELNSELMSVRGEMGQGRACNNHVTCMWMTCDLHVTCMWTTCNMHADDM